MNSIKNTAIILFAGLVILICYISSSCKSTNYENNSNHASLIPSINDWPFSEKIEKSFTTPCYAHSVAVLAASAHTNDKNLIESGMLAIDVVTEDMSKNWSAGSHGDFYTWPAMFALNLYKGIADEERYEKWSDNIAMMNPEEFYRTYLNAGNFNVGASMAVF